MKLLTVLLTVGVVLPTGLYMGLDEPVRKSNVAQSSATVVKAAPTQYYTEAEVMKYENGRRLSLIGAYVVNKNKDVGLITDQNFSHFHSVKTLHLTVMDLEEGMHKTTYNKLRAEGKQIRRK
jgi:hypothetical protein